LSNAPSTELLRQPRLGLYGGSFDPPHAGHLAVLRAARRSAALEALLLVPAARSPHKQQDTLFSDGQRLALLDLLIDRESDCAIWTYEIERPAPSFSVNTLEELDRLRGRGLPRPYLILGSDQLPGLARWHRLERVFELAEPLVVQRGARSAFESQLGAAQAALPWLAERLRLGAIRLARPHPANSTAIRAALAAGQTRVPHLPVALQRAIQGFHRAEAGPAKGKSTRR
jgi:nicotinate-nucleotide adenylyltransferase